MKKLLDFNPSLLITLLLFVAVAIMACTPQPAFAGECTACHTVSVDATPLALADTDEGFGMALTATQTMGLPINEGLKPAPFIRSTTFKTSGNSPAYIGAGSSDVNQDRSMDTALIVAGVTFALIPAGQDARMAWRQESRAPDH